MVIYINNLREKFSPGPGFEPGSLVWPSGSSGWLSGIAPAQRAGDPGSNPGPGKNFSHKLLILTSQMVILKAKITYIYIYIYI